MLERRSDTGEPVSPAPEKKTGSGGKKPVIVYILVLFTVAFLLMIWSLFSHQRSNAEAIGQLQGSLTAMQEVQDLQDRVIHLQQELSEAQEALDDAQEQLGVQTQEIMEKQARAELAAHEIEALYYLYALQQQYLLQNFDSCRETIQAMENGGMVKFLSDGGGAVGVTSPALRYKELKEAVEALEG